MYDQTKEHHLRDNSVVRVISLGQNTFTQKIFLSYRLGKKRSIHHELPLTNLEATFCHYVWQQISDIKAIHRLLDIPNRCFPALNIIGQKEKKWNEDIKILFFKSYINIL